MSKVYSFRLSDDNPREAQARKLIEALVGQGYSMRLVITNGLLTLHQSKVNQIDLDQVIEELKTLVWELRDNQEDVTNAQKENTVLEDVFIEGVKKSLRPGTRTIN